MTAAMAIDALAGPGLLDRRHNQAVLVVVLVGILRGLIVVVILRIGLVAVGVLIVCGGGLLGIAGCMMPNGA